MAEAGWRRHRNASPGNRVANHAALGLYEKAGFKRRQPFADCRPDPLSVFMERPL
jgi:hypothetical protein